MRQDQRDRIIEERTARLRALRLAAEASRKLDREVAKKAAASRRAKETSNRETAKSIPVDDLNAANDK
jgi:DNA primase large subunit